MSRNVAAQAVALLCLAAIMGCAGLAKQGRQLPPSPSQQAWLALRDGRTRDAEALFARAAAERPGGAPDVRALFGTASLAFERADISAAANGMLALLAWQGGARTESAEERLAATLATSVVGRLGRVLGELPAPLPIEERLLALGPERLPWQGQYALGLVVMDLARRRGDERLLTATLSRLGCARSMTLLGTRGKFAHLDLSSDEQTVTAGRLALQRTGCGFEVPADHESGIKLIRATLDTRADKQHVVLDFAGPARWRFDGGPWHDHGRSADAQGARWSAASVQGPPGEHVVEIELGTQGDAVAVSLLTLHERVSLVPRAPSGSAPDGDVVMLALAHALIANVAGDLDALLEGIEGLQGYPRFSLGLATAGRLVGTDPTRPRDVARDDARANSERAVDTDGTMARAWLDLANIEMQNERAKESAAYARRAVGAAPGWWPARAALSSALRAQGLEESADAELGHGLAALADGQGGCDMVERAFLRAEERDQEAKAAALIERLAGCDAQSELPRSWARRHGNVSFALARAGRALPTTASPSWLQSEIADLRVAQGDLEGAEAALLQVVATNPRDFRARVRIADVQLALGRPDEARRTLSEARRLFPVKREIERAAALVGMEHPVEPWRVDGDTVIRDYLSSGRAYQAPAVVVLDRAVERTFADGTRMLLTHTITQVLSKDATESVGEVHVPPDAEVLRLRTRKADGSSREAEAIVGKPSISTPNLDVGDFVEVETLEVKPPRRPFAPGFVGERFYFRSFLAPLHRSEYVLVLPRGMSVDVDRRGESPAPSETIGPDGARVLTFRATEMPQVFAERASVPPQEWLPAVRVAAGVDVRTWSRWIADGFVRAVRPSPALRRVAAALAKPASRDLAAAIAAWVDRHIEPESSFLEPATSTLARGRGNRAGVMLALARLSSTPADLVIARSLRNPDLGARTASWSDIEDFRDLLVRFRTPQGDRFVSPFLRRAPFGYVPPTLDGAVAVIVGTDEIVKVRSSVPDRRSVELRVQMNATGGARVEAVEQLAGWPAIEWAELLERNGKDRAKLRQEFEQRSLGHHFPGAQLDALEVEPLPGAAGMRVSYSFQTRLAAREGRALRFRPVFFRAQPGKRYASEPDRKTTLQMGDDIPVDLNVAIHLPSGANVAELGQGARIDAGAIHFVEQRSLEERAGADPLIRVRRQFRLPIARVDPESYPQVAAKLRAIDPVEEAEIRIELPPP